MNTRDLNLSLNQLQKVINKIENLSDTGNYGFRSIKNLAVWLILFALTEKAAQTAIINEIAQAASLTPAETDAVKKTIYTLCMPQCFMQIIQDYEKASGSFAITVSRDFYKKVAAKAGEVGLGFLIEHYFHENKDKARISVAANNRIQFLWSDPSLERVKECAAVRDTFNNTEGAYLLASNYTHSTNYYLTKFNDQSYHLVSFKVFQQPVNPSKLAVGTVYFIEPVDKINYANLHNHYYDIIDQTVEHDLKDKNHAKIQYERLKLLKDANQLSDLEMSETETSYDVRWYDINVPIRYQFTLEFRFPKLAAKLSTVETRLGIYSLFREKTIGNMPNVDMAYEGIRELAYDEKGGEIINKETCNIYGSCRKKRNPYIIKHISLKYTIRNPFLFVYESPDAADYYPFKIVNPYQGLNDKNSMSGTKTSSYIGNFFAELADLLSTQRASLERVSAALIEREPKMISEMKYR